MRINYHVLYILPSSIIFLAGLASLFSIEIGLCSASAPSCIVFYSLFAIKLIVPGLALLLVSPIVGNIFFKWKFFAMWYIPLAILVLIFYHPNPLDLALPSVELVTITISIIYVLVSYWLLLKTKNEKK